MNGVFHCLPYKFLIDVYKHFSHSCNLGFLTSCIVVVRLTHIQHVLGSIPGSDVFLNAVTYVHLADNGYRDKQRAYDIAILAGEDGWESVTHFIGDVHTYIQGSAHSYRESLNFAYL